MAECSKYSYRQFRDAVKKRLASNLGCYELNDEELDAYMRHEEYQIKAEFDDYAEDALGEVKDGKMTEDASFKASVNSVAYCLQMCY